MYGGARLFARLCLGCSFVLPWGLFVWLHSADVWCLSIQIVSVTAGLRWVLLSILLSHFYLCVTHVGALSEQVHVDAC
jgi:hypothetical protein